MNTYTFTAFRRGKRRDTLVIWAEIDEEAFVRGPFLRRVFESQPSARRFELCFHGGYPEDTARSGRRLRFEHVEAEVPAHVRTLLISIGPGAPVEIRSRQPREFD